MSWVDMVIEYRESIIINRAINSSTKTDEEEDEVRFNSKGEEILNLTQEEIDEEFEKLDIEELNLEPDAQQ